MPDWAAADLIRQFAIQRIEKLQPVVAFVKCEEVGGVDFLVQMVIFVAAADVMREDVFQGGKNPRV